MNLELLAPAGSPEILISVINAGADAVYVGGDRFGARAYAANFHMEDLLWAIDYVHLHGKKLYLTVNTLLKNKEIEQELYDYIAPLYEAGLDAVLVQDYGVLNFLKKYFPDLPLHASTQLTSNSKESVAYLKSLGVERVVLSRELSLKEMKEIHDETGVELEAFVHGALCYSYSGMCLFSSILGGRSGNRGRCAQPCRLSYDVLDTNGILLKDNYILSLKDHCAYSEIKELHDAGIYSLKIEGRMKQAEYAYGVTKLYADAIKDGASKNAISELKAFGNRGGFTNSYLYKNNDSEMITYKDPSLHKQDALPFADIAKKKLPVYGFLKLAEGEKAELTVCYGDLSIVVSSENRIEKAQKNPAVEQEVLERMNKTGASDFYFEQLDVSMENHLFVPNGVLNTLRRDGLEQIKDKILRQYKRSLTEKKFILEKAKNTTAALCEVSVSITDDSAIDAVIKSPIVNNVYLLLSKNAENAVKRLNACGKNVYFMLPAILRNKDVAIIEEMKSEIEEMDIKGFVVANTDSFALIKRLFPGYEIIGDHSLYSFNNYATAMLKEMGCTRLTAPLELNKAELMHRDNYNSEFVIYGRYPLMQTANCVCKNSKGCKKNPEFLFLKDRYNAKFPVMNVCEYCYNTIYNSLPTNLISQFEDLKNMGFETFRFMFTDESSEDIQKILKNFEAVLSHKEGYNFKKDYTNGHYKRGVE